MLNDLKVLNGNLELSFNNLNYEYTVEVEEDIKKLEFSFKYDDGVNIEVIDNDLKNIDNIVYIKVSKENEEDIYTLYVHKKVTNEVTGIDLFKSSLDIEKEEIALYKVQILGISIFLIIVIIFCLLFKKRKIK